MNNKAHLRPKDFDSNGDIIPMACKEEKGDLISRNALIQHAYSAVVDGVEKDIIDLSDVDNAPTIEPEVKKVPIASVTFGTEKLKELTDEIVERIKNGEIVLQDERPQGEWIDVNGDGSLWKCSNCGEKSCCKGNYCPDCGARMKGGAE